MKRFLYFLVIMIFASQSVYARSFAEFLDHIKIQALSKGISEQTINKTWPHVKYVKKAVTLDRRQSEFTVTFEKYQQNQLPNSRIKKAVRFLKKNKATFDVIEKRYQVPREQIVALWAIESNFGKNTGGFHIPSVLATLAYDGRRAELFTKQFLDALTIIDQGHISAKGMIGSWAGAMGQSQFMPSSFLQYAVDYTRDGTADIWRAKADVWASIGNYLSTEGWRMGANVTMPVKLPKNFTVTEKLEKEYNSIAMLQKLGVQFPKSAPLYATAKLIVPDRSTQHQAFIAFKNFDVLLHWNRSYFFALTASKLAQKIKMAM